MMRKILFFLVLFNIAFSAHAQLGDIHYLPPLKQGRNNQGIQQQEVHLSTPEPVAFAVNVFQGTNPTPIATYTISNAGGAIHPLPNGDNNITLVNNANTGVVLTNSGLRFESTTGDRFYVNYRGRSGAQAASLTSKGRQSLGTNFKWGGVPNLGSHVSKSNTLGIMATEDNTTITLSDYDPACTFRLGANADGITADIYTITLDENESFVFENYVGTRNIPSHIDGWLGASVVSDKPIVISNGAMNFGTQAGQAHRDAGIDQPVPINNVGKDYVFIRGNGPTIAEFPVIIATADDTDIFLSGSAVPIATIDEGEYFKVPTSFFSSTAVGANMYVRTSKDVYAYQSMAGHPSRAWTQGLNFIAPLDCLFPDFLNNIPDIRNMAGATITGGMTIIASTSTPDANIRVFENGVEITKPAPNAVAGQPDWKTFFIDGLDGDISLQSTGPMAVGFFGFDGARGVAGYFSGFDTIPEVVLDVASGAIGDCFSDANIFVATENFDAYQWFYEGVAIPGANTITYADTRAGDYFVLGTKGPCEYASDPLTILHCEPDISVTKTVADPEITEGETTVFTIEAKNWAFEPITNLQITDNLPAGVTFVSAHTLSGTWNGSVWNIGTLDPDESAILELTVRGDEIATEPLISITNTVTPTQDQVDSNQTEDILSVDLIIHNDFDNDGVVDIVDLDDDNDGIYDTDECGALFCFETIVNESFEDPTLTRGFQLLNETAIPGWFTTATDSQIELWTSGFQGVDSFHGNQHAELNANQFGALYQNLCLAPGTIMNWSFRHRGRNGVDEMRLLIGGDLSSLSEITRVATDNNAWVLYSGTYTVPANQTNTLFVFEAIATANSNISVGNFIDDINIRIAVPATCMDTDSDGFPNNIDLDSDGDGCSDADEWYKDNNADADDGGEFGSGVPVVDPINGTVIAASYDEVLAPEILLENTSEDLGGADINGQNVSLGDTFSYVLRFQNTGDDHASNYSIRNILPSNANLDNIDLSGAPGVVSNHDPITNIISLQIPDNLVEIGDPEYLIRITVTLSANCTDFASACSETLINTAYSTYEGLTTGNTYSDEPGSTNLPVCSPIPPVATNSLLNDLANCNVARTVQLCGDNITLTAGAGFTDYTWALDANGNGQIDASEPAINDGNPDNDSSTLFVTSIGNYIVEKSGATGCADLVELITVERFGSAQSNPISDYFNQVNADANADNDLQGQFVTCSIDGTVIPEIFLCGENDEVLIQLGITDRDNIVWQKLDVTSCAASVVDCPNTNPGCSWTDLAVEDFYNITDAGEYRIVINYDGGCFSRFYFNVFKNTLDIDYISSNIICTTEGNIRITNPVTGFGFQLVDANTDAIVIPFSANNGPNFDITTNGSYKVQVTQINPATNDPIPGACIFETEDIGILERTFDVTASSIAADCSGFGEISVQALNVLPNYDFKLFTNTGNLIEENLGNPDNDYTFTTVPAGMYELVTTSDDGCEDRRVIEVEQIPALNLSASVTENITCNAGLISLTPNGGDPDPDYRMAIYSWSGDASPRYSSPADALANATFQSTNDFLFLTGAEAGDYVFIVFDSNDCHELSNQVALSDLGTVNISASHTEIICAGSTTSTLTIMATGGLSPYEYSIDGTNFQSTDTFTNLGGGMYTITVRDSSGTITSRCTETIDYEIDQPFALNASAALIEDVACDPNGTLVKIRNASGGLPPYQYSFDGGSNFDPNNERSLLAGTYQLVVQDALGCTLDLELSVPSSVADPILTAQPVAYDCLGEGIITVNTSNTTDFNYTYALNGTGNTPADDNVFNDVPAGNHTITVGYSSALTPAQSNFLVENFGTGSNTAIAEIGPGYCYEPQDFSTTTCNVGPVGILVNSEYSVTSFVTNPVTSWRSPNDQNGLTDGRFLAIAVSTTPGLNNILWQRTGLEVLTNQEINFSFYGYNLLRTGQLGNNPEVLVELIDAGGNVIDSFVTAEIPKNNNADDWHFRPGTLNPGANTSVGIVLRTNIDSDDGNLLVIDSIIGTQLPVACERTQDLAVIVEANQAFAASLLGVNEPSCPGAADGSIRFEVSNFDATVGYEYSLDGGTTWTPETNSPFTTAANLADGSYTVMLRKADDTSCATDFSALLTEPTAILPALQLTSGFTCFNTGATLEASATQGTPGYEYQLEDTAGGVITAYQTNSTFTNVPAGDYLVRVRDANNCEVLLALTDAVTVAAPETIAFDTTPTACYSGANNGSITVNVTAGNGNYEFRITNGGVSSPWTAPTPSTATSHTFIGLSEGSYDIEVRDQLGCPNTSNAVTVVIADQLIIDVDVTPLSSCTNGGIIVNATGGNGTLLYAIVPANSSPTGLFGATNTLTITEAMAAANPAGYDVYVQDNNGAPALCTATQEDIIFTPVPTLSLNVIPTDPECFDGLGSIDINITGGSGPYTYTLDDLSPADGIDYGRSSANIPTTTLSYDGIGVGNYEVAIEDDFGCTVTSAMVTINNGVQITADLAPILPPNCDDPLNTPADFGFSFINVTNPTGTIEYSADGGTTWQASNELRGHVSGTEVFPSIRVEVAPGVYCQQDFGRYLIPFPLDDLDITLSAIVVGCNDLQVTVEGSEGDDTSGYDYTYTDDPASFNTFILDPNVWVNNVPSGTAHTFQNSNPTTPQYPEVPLLVPGRTFVFYVRDGAGCIRQSNVNVNEIAGIGLPIAITTDITPSCDGAANGVITFNINPSMSFPNMRWEIFELGNSTPIEVSGGGAIATNVAYSNSITTTVPLAEGDYYIDIIQVDGGNVDACRGASENAYVPELAPISATATATRDISCNLPGLITISNITGGGGPSYTYDVTGPVGFAALTGTTNNPVEIPVNSPAGVYTVTLYDQYRCSLVLNTVSLALSPNPTLTVDQVNCAAPITVNASGTSTAGNMRYAMVPTGNPAPTSFDDNAGVFTNISPGGYDVYVIDGNGCTAVETNFVVNPVLSASADLTKLIDCTASPDAVITIDIADGSGSYEYSITNTAGVPAVTQTSVPANTFDYQAPIAGDYTITIFDTATPDNAICNREFVIRVPARIAPVIDPNIVTSDISCFGANDGSITIATTNRTAAPYSFEITSLDGGAVSILPSTTTATAATFTGLAPSTGAGYIVTVTGDAATNNCSVNSIAIPILEPNDITLNIPPASFGCTTGNVANNAIITANASGGSGTFNRYVFIDIATTNVLQDGSSNTYAFTNIAGGDVEVTVYDDTGCSQTSTITIQQFDELQSASISIVDPLSCTSSGEDISIDITGAVTNFTSNPTNYEIRQLPSTVYETPGDNTFNNLVVGTYNFGVRNITTACEIFIEHTVAEPNTFDVSIEVLANVVCFGDDGSIQLTVVDANYTGGFTYDIFNTNGTSADRSDDGPAVLSGNSATLGPTGAIAVPAGEYLVEVMQDAFPECSQVRSFTITTPPAAITLNPITISSVNCSNDQGTANISPLGGVAPYTIEIEHIPSGTTTTETNVNAHIFDALSAGDYNVTVTDALGCIEVFATAFSLILPDALTGTIDFTGIECIGDTDGDVSFNLDPTRNVTPNYNYSLNTYDDAAGATLLRNSVLQTSPNFDNLGTGFYSITASDDIGCVFETPIIEIIEPTEVDALLVIDTPISCTTGADLLLTASGGTAPYEWSEDNIGYNMMSSGADTHFIQNVMPGSYNYYVRDSFNCVSIVSNTVTINPIEPLAVAADVVATLSCFNDNTAIIMANTEGGLGEYEYALFDDTNTEIRSNQTSQTFTDLPSGIYYVRVQGRGDCEAVSPNVTIENPDEMIVTETVTPITCTGENDGIVTLETIGGTGQYLYAISPNLNQFESSNTFEGLEPGDYTIIAQDSNGCFELIEFSLEDPEQLVMTLSATPEICAGEENGSITVTPSGGTPPYSTAINSASDQDFVEDRLAINDLAGGDYIIFMRDANGCLITDVITVELGANLNATAEVIYECSGDTPTNRVILEFEDDTVINDVLYALDSTDPNDLVLESNFENLPAGEHFIYMAHANGCSETLEFVVEDFEPLVLTLEQLDLNEITATAAGGREGYTYYFDGQDNVDDNVFHIRRTDTYEVRVVDANGCEATASIFIEFIDIEIPNFFTPDGDGRNDVWVPRNIQQFPDIFIKIYDRYGREVYRMKDNQDSWDGLYQESDLPTGDYWYVIKLNGEDDEREFVGNFTLYR